MISKNLKEAGFIAIRKDSKLPIAEKGEDWNDKILDYEQANAELRKGNNIAIVGGYNGFVVLDSDGDDTLYNAFSNYMYKTYTETSITGNKHLIYRTDNWTTTKEDNCDFNQGTKHLGELRAFRRYVVIAPSKAKDEKKGVFDVRPYKVLEDNPVCLISREDIAKVKNNLGLQTIKKDGSVSENKDESRSALEYRKVISLLYDGKSKEEVYQSMMAYAKWKEAPDSYKDYTFNKAQDYVESKLAEVENKENEITWLDLEYMDTWEFVKAYSKKKWGHKKEYDNKKTNWTFFAHSHNTIKGKPQLIENVQKRIPLIRSAIKSHKVEVAVQTDEGTAVSKEEKEIQSFYFFDEKFDKRHDGFQTDSFAMNFWAYRIISEEGLEYYVLSQTKLPSETCTCKGMLIELDDFAEMSRSMKLKSLSRVFILKEFEPSVKILTPEQIVTFTRERKITEADWLNYLSYHKQLNSQNRFPIETEMLRSAHLLSGKKDGWPIHLGAIGRAGTKKTCGYLETIAQKFAEEPVIVEGANSRIKGLIPSFKEKPANIGYLAESERMGWIDELGKMVEFELNKHQTTQNNVLGELNSLLEHKKRRGSSGNDNEVDFQANAKFIFVMNPISNKNTIYSHVGIMDSTFMSRVLWWVQDNEEVEFVTGHKGIVRLPPRPTQAHINKNNEDNIKINKNTNSLGLVLGEIMVRDEFLTLYDTCYSFLSDLDYSKVQTLADTITMLAKEPMKSVWKPRAEHHITLLIDGLCKHRCLFKDYDSSFIAKQEDYDLAERILIRMVKAWDTDLSINQTQDTIISHATYRGGRIQ